MSRDVVLLSGAAGGIGSAVFRALQDLWSVVSVDLEPTDDDGGEVHASVAGDVTEPDTWDRAVRAAHDLGPLRAVVNNAGAVGKAAVIEDTELDEFERVLRNTLTSSFLGVRAGFRHITGAGAIVNVVSNAGLQGVRRFGSYSSAKHGMIGLTRTAALEAGRSGLRVNAVCPGPTETPMMDSVAGSLSPESPAAVAERMRKANPTGRFARPEEVAEAVAWLLSDRASYVNGAILNVDGGLTAG